MSAFRHEFSAGWRNLGAATIGLGFGIPMYNPISSLFLRALTVQFAWSRTAAAAGLVALPITALLHPFVGQLIDRFGVRRTSAISAVCLTACYLWLSQLGNSLPEYYIAVVALFVLGSCTGPIAYTQIVTKRFDKARGTALAAAQLGVALIAVALPPILARPLGQGHWREGYILLAGITAVGGIAAQLLMERTATTSPPQRREPLPARQVLSRAAFWILGLALLSISAGSLGLVSQLQSVLIERGIAASVATILLSAMALSVVVSRLVAGRVLDLPHPAKWAALMLAIASTGAILLLASHGSTAIALVAVLLLGISLGAELDVMSFFCARLFGLKHYSAIYGMLGIFFGFGIAVGGISYGVIRDLTGGYTLGLALTLVMLIAASGLFLLLDRFDADETGQALVSGG